MLEVSQGIDSAGGTQFVFTTGYWSSTEYFVKNELYAWYFGFNHGDASNNDKIATLYVRAVRKFSI